MPQQFQVLKCYKCSVFQVHQTKKSNKFECKLCGEKQSIKRHFGLGTAKDCRLHVQKLNGIRGEIEELNSSQSDTSEDVKEPDKETRSRLNGDENQNKTSKWSAFVEENEECINNSETDTMYLGETEVVLEIPMKRKKNNIKTKRNQKHLSGVACVEEMQRLTDEDKIPVGNILFNTENTELNNVHESYMDCLNNSQIETVPVKRFVPPTLNKNSKWAQYTEDDSSAENNTIQKNNCPKKFLANKKIFSLCDDTDLDAVLDI